MADYTYGGIDPRYIAQIKGFEGFTPRAKWDYAQHSNGYGTRARHDGEVIDQAEAERRLHEEISRAAGIVDSYAPNLDPGTRAALASLTYNSGDKWTRSGLGQAIKSGDMTAARQRFLEYVKADGTPLPGLQKRREAEVGWFGQGGDQVASQSALPARGMSGATFHAAAFPAPYALGGPKEAVQPDSRNSVPTVAKSQTPATEQPSGPAWDSAAFWENRMLSGHADGGAVDDDLLADYRKATAPDPLTDYRTKFQDGLPPIVTPESRDGRGPGSFGVMSATPNRPADWAVSSGIAEAISPTMGGYGLGAGLGTTSNALMQQDWAGAAEAGLPLAMAMVPGLKGKPAAVVAEQPKGIRAYHGSPHDFDKFDASKIGTGEGAQAYGHGLYFAEQEGVAKSYRDTLSHKDGGIDGIAQSLVNMAGGDWSAAAAKFERQVNKQKAMADAAGLKYEIPDYDMRTLEALKKGQPGRMYEVNIKADPEHFLDWDKPLAEQSSEVQRVIAKNDRAQVNKDLLKRNMRPLSETMRNVLKDPEYSETLSRAGIPGIRYLDQGSRGAGEGSRNYVVFDPATIEIMRKYGLLGPMAGGVAAGAMNGDGEGQNGDQGGSDYRRDYANGGRVGRALAIARKANGDR